MAEEPTAPPDPAPARVLFLGAGPLPAADSPHAPGVANRLWNFLQPSILAGHDCFALTIENDAAPFREDLTPARRQFRGHSWRHLALPTADFQNAAKLAPIVGNFQPTVIASAGTLLAGAAACQIAGDVPVWVDLFGDPLAEIQAQFGRNAFSSEATRNRHLYVWELVLRVLFRADAFSTVSRRQRDALLGQLLLLGMADEPDPADLEMPMGSGWVPGLIHTIPCGMESFKPPFVFSPADRADWRAAHELPRDAFVALWSGGFNVWSDPATLFRAMNASMNQIPQLRLVVTGGSMPQYHESSYRVFREMVSSSQDAARFHLLDWLPFEEALKWVAMADVGLSVDRRCSETQLGSRNRLLTFAAGRLPIIASRGTEIVADMEAAGALQAFKQGNPRNLSRRLRHAFEAPASTAAMAERALAFCNDYYRFRKTIRPFLQFVASAQQCEKRFKGRRAPARSQREFPLAAELIFQYLDPEQHRAEWAELARYRSGRLNRLRQWIKSWAGAS